MSEMVSISKEELEQLKERTRRLAQEKSYLQLVNAMITKLGEATGLENAAETIARLVLETVGGSNVIVYFLMDGVVHYADVYGDRKTLDALDDALVKEAMERQTIAEIYHDFADTKMLTPAFTEAATWAIPLTAGTEVVGVLKMEGMLLGARDIRHALAPFFTYSALVLKNEIEDHTQLKHAYEQLSSANEALREEIGERERAEAQLLNSKQELELGVAERTLELKTANERLLLELTERKRVEDAIQNQFSTLTGIIENANALIFSVDRQFRYTCFNEAHKAAMKAIYGTDIEVGRSLLECQTIAVDRGTSRRNIERALAGETLVQEAYSGDELRLRRYHEVSHSPIKANDGSVIGVVILAWDITDRRRAEEALRQKTTEAEHFFDVSLDLVCIAGSDTYFRRFNSAWERVLGYSKEELQAKSFMELIHPDDVKSTEEAVAELASQRKVIDFVNRYRCKDGSYRWLDWRAVPDGELIYASARDITDQKRASEEQAKLREQFVQAQKMESIGILAGGVAHDFNNLLTVILACTELALERVSEDSFTRQDLMQIRNAGLRASTLTRQLLAFGRRQVLQPALHDLNRLVTGIEKMLHRIIGEDIRIHLELAPDLGVTMVDAGQIEQVIMNLVVNARDAMPEGGRLTIETSNVDLDAEGAALHVEAEPGPRVMLMVADTGCGMDEPTRKRIFEPFFTTKPQGRGTGLGLSTVFGIVAQSGGNIWVYSEPGKGTSFKIYFPRERGGSSIPFEAPSITPPTGTETILVVEDEVLVRKLAARILEMGGYTVVTAESGTEALSICEERPGNFQLLLTDVVMPLMSGKELADRLAKVSPGLRVLYMSGYAVGAVAQYGAIEAGAPFIAKPFNPSELLKKVREVIDLEP